MELTADQLRELLNYDPDTGVFRYKKSRGRFAAGDVAGCDTGKGYIRIRLFGRLYRAHRLAWLYVHGRWPAEQIDHVNGQRADNRICNLREATFSENQWNRSIGVTNTSGFKGITPAKPAGRWKAVISINGRSRHIGTFDTPEEAHAAYAAAALARHGDFVRLA